MKIHQSIYIPAVILLCAFGCSKDNEIPSPFAYQPPYDEKLSVNEAIEQLFVKYDSSVNIAEDFGREESSTRTYPSLGWCYTSGGELQVEQKIADNAYLVFATLSTNKNRLRPLVVLTKQNYSIGDKPSAPLYVLTGKTDLIEGMSKAYIFTELDNRSVAQGIQRFSFYKNCPNLRKGERQSLEKNIDRLKRESGGAESEPLKRALWTRHMYDVIDAM